jgi:3-methyladenine DNA glycosylase AlkC
MPFADELINDQTATALARAIGAARPEAPLPALRQVVGRLAHLALRERADLLADALMTDIAGDYRDLARVIRSARYTDPSFTGWMIWPVTSAVAAKAVADGTNEAFDDAMALIAELTGRLTAEFAIRTLLRHDLERALPIIFGWTGSDDVDVRRLATEGTRPYLPWSTRVPGIIGSPGVTVSILDALYRDPSEYVRRSVANHLNDLSRDNPDLVVETAARWLADPGPETERTVRHGLRTLIKKGDPGALALLGFTPVVVQVDGPTLDRAAVPIGESITFRATVTNLDSEPARLAIDYLVYHRKANGTQSAKTFKLTTMTLASGASIDVSREHSFRVITTRRYHPGSHAIALQVNGKESVRVGFELLPGR